MNTKSRGVVYMKGRSDEYVELDSQSYNNNDDIKTQKDKRTFVNKTVNNYSPGNNQARYKNFNNENHFYKKNIPTSQNGKFNQKNYKKANNEPENRNEKFSLLNDEKKNKFNFDNIKRESNQYNNSESGYGINNHSNIDLNKSVNGSNENYCYKINNFYNTIKNEGVIRKNFGTNMTDNNSRKIIQNEINGNNQISNWNNSKNYGITGNNFTHKKIMPNGAYFNTYMPYNSYTHPNVAQTMNNLPNNIFGPKQQPNLYFNNNIYNNKQAGNAHAKASCIMENDNYHRINKNVNHNNFSQNCNSNINSYSNNLNKVGNKNSSLISEKIKSSIQISPSLNNITNSPNSEIFFNYSLNPKQILDEKTEIVKTEFRENKNQDVKLKISEKLNISEFNLLDFKDRIKSKLFCNLIEKIQITSNTSSTKINEKNQKNCYIVHDNNINIQSGSICSNHDIKNIDKNNSIENLSHEESTRNSTNDSDRGRCSLNNKKNTIDVSVSQPFNPLNMSQEYLTRNRLISDAEEYLKSNLNHPISDRSIKSPKINSYTQRKNNNSLRDKKLPQQNIRRLFCNEKNSYSHQIEKNKFNKFSHFDRNSTFELKNSYTNEVKTGQFNLNPKTIRKDSFNMNKPTNSENMFKKLSYSSVDHTSNKTFLNEVKNKSKSFNLLNYKINASNISLQSNTSSENDDHQLLTVLIQIDKNSAKEISIKRHQNIFTTAKKFCDENKMNPLLINSISSIIQRAISSINEIFNSNLIESNENCLADLHKLYTTNSFSQDAEFNLKQGFNSPYNNLSCFTLLNSDEEDELDLNNSLNYEDEYKSLNITM